MEVPLYNQKGEKIKTVSLPSDIFDVKMNQDLVWQVVVSQMANRRKNIAHTKDRAEVKGGGRKPWRQKGTGRARHGSIRSPLWRGGGVTFGPTNLRNFKKKIPKKMRKKALFMALSEKARRKLLILLDKLEISKPKTKLASQILSKFLKKGESALVVIPKKDDNLLLSLRNIPKISVTEARNLNCLDILSFKYLIVPKESLSIIEKTFYPIRKVKLLFRSDMFFVGLTKTLSAINEKLLFCLEDKRLLSDFFFSSNFSFANSFFSFFFFLKIIAIIMFYPFRKLFQDLQKTYLTGRVI